MKATQIFRFGSIVGPVGGAGAGASLAQVALALDQSATEERVLLLVLASVLYVMLAIIGWRMIESAKLKDSRLVSYKSDMSGPWFIRTFMIIFGTFSIVDNYTLDWIERGIALTWVSTTILVISLLALLLGLVMVLRDKSIETKITSQSQQIASETSRG